MAKAHVLGFPRIGAQRELKFAQEAFWRDQLSAAQLQQVGKELRARHWAMQAEAGMDYVCVGDFAWYDQVLNTLALLGALPARFGFKPDTLDLTEYFAAARGNQAQPAMEMTKWFDTNYHYLVPEWQEDSQFPGGTNWLFEELAEAQQAGHAVKVVLLGPLSLLRLGKPVDKAEFDVLQLLPRLLPAYQGVLSRLKAAGVSWVQIDEPILALELEPAWRDALQASYSQLAQDAPQILLASYFAGAAEYAALLQQLPIAGLHLDLISAPEQLAAFIDTWPADKVLSCGLIDGRNIWRADLSALLNAAHVWQAKLGERLWLASSCSLLHVPVDLAQESKLDAELISWLAFGKQKLQELQTLKTALNGDTHAVIAQITAAQVAQHKRQHSQRIHNSLVQKRMQALLTGTDYTEQRTNYAQRSQAQAARFQLPLFPTTSIGSFPQTSTIRAARAAHKKGTLGALDYLAAMRQEIDAVIAQQERLGLDVLVHGEAERNDMVEYFAEYLWGFAITELGWVQSYGSRCVKPPIIYGDVYRPDAISVEWSRYAQSRTHKPVKGMLTGPVTMLQWSFVRNDQPRQQTALQIALALREEVQDLERAGIGMIQIDEPALREGLPLRQQQWPAYLDWAVRAFKLSCAHVQEATQIHTHMCYSQFQDILPWIAALDADVITIETSRSKMSLLDAFAQFAYPNQIGPGVYDIHSPRVPSIAQIRDLLERARQVIPDERLWVNPDCGLKTRNWPETLAALSNMVAAAQMLRASCAAEQEDAHAHEGDARACC